MIRAVEVVMRLLAFLFVLLVLPAFRPGPLPDPSEQAAAQVRAAARAWLEARYPSLAPRMEVRVLRLSPEAQDTLAAAALPLRINAPGRAALPRGRTQVALLGGNDTAGWSRLGWALLYVAHYDSVLIPTRRMAADEPLTEDALRTAWVETTTFRGEPLTPAAFRALRADGELLAERSLREGRPLRRSDVRPPYAAEVGDAVAMRFQRGRITLLLPCKAREPGFVGDVIRLYSPDTRTTYRARLTAAGAAEWIETL
ncbi:flagella basal body P-ring formation protein FlgA [Rhodothermaceae bacterium RA]|nr:flagella basal body P-ring formation protein FlgA [Rhodothermaceae bacterium RA]